jgi:hypothetical protein
MVGFLWLCLDLVEQCYETLISGQGTEKPVASQHVMIKYYLRLCEEGLRTLHVRAVSIVLLAAMC